MIRFIALISLMFTKTVFASSAVMPLTDIQMTQDIESIKRGALVYYNTCRICHGMKYIKYQSLQEIGFTVSEIDKLRGDKLISSTMVSRMNKEVSLEYYGMVPPDLSVMAKARKHGPQYIYTLMTSYTEQDNIYDNSFFPGIKMPDIFNISTVMDDSTKAVIEGKAKDVTEFLTWAADPRAAERKNLGKYVIAYLIILSIMFYMVMKRVWSRLDT